MVENAVLALIGLSAGGIVAAGVFAFLTALGLLQRLADKTGTASGVRLYEDSITLGGTLGNLILLYDIRLAGGAILCGIIGLCYGIFIGCLIMSLAETLDGVPIFSRRLRLSGGMSAIVWGMGLGKMIGSTLFFFWGMGG